MKRLPSGAITMPERPPKILAGEVSTSPPRNSSLPNRFSDESPPRVKYAIGSAAISMGVVAVTGADAGGSVGWAKTGPEKKPSASAAAASRAHRMALRRKF